MTYCWASPDFSRRLARDCRVLRSGDECRLPLSCVDIGCGSGRDSIWLANRGWKVMGASGLFIGGLCSVLSVSVGRPRSDALQLMIYVCQEIEVPLRGGKGVLG